MFTRISFLGWFLVTVVQEKISSNIWKGEGKQKLLLSESRSNQTNPDFMGYDRFIIFQFSPLVHLYLSG